MKSEARNKIANRNDQNCIYHGTQSFWSFEPLCFGFVSSLLLCDSCFEFRI